MKKSVRSRVVLCSECGEEYDPLDARAEAQHAHDTVLSAE